MNTFNQQYTELTRMMMEDAVSKGGNSVCSPLSFCLLMLLAMHCTNGASREEIENALVPGATEGEIEKIIGMLPGFSKDRQLASSNGICIVDALKNLLDEEFVNELKKKFDADIFSAGNNPLRKINSWVKEKTRGKIERIVDELPKDFGMCLLNALAFEAKWKEKYEENDICEGIFYGFNRETEVSYMSSKENRFVESDCFRGFIKEYQGSRYAFMALLPREKGNHYLKNSIRTLNFFELYRKSENLSVHITIPEFDCETKMDLVETAKSLGIKEIFTENADFSPMVNDEPLVVSSIVQKATVKVNRSGTKAAAATVMYAVMAGMFDAKRIYLDRPFVYAIIDKENEGLPVFAGTFEG